MSEPTTGPRERTVAVVATCSPDGGVWTVRVDPGNRLYTGESLPDLLSWAAENLREGDAA
jgi:hypothetical protein